MITSARASASAKMKKESVAALAVGASLRARDPAASRTGSHRRILVM